jgi:HAD superfamily hydrolase (TIGR01509 family)
VPHLAEQDDRRAVRAPAGRARLAAAPIAAPFAAVVFDNDGLLLDSEEAWTRAERALYARYGREFTDVHKRELLGSAAEQQASILARHLPDDGTELQRQLHELSMIEIAAGAEPCAGALELVEALHVDGVPLALASNSSRAFVHTALSTLPGLAKRFRAIVTFEDVERPKPAPDLYHLACARLGAAPEGCAALEDSPTGVAAAHAAGLYVIGVPSQPGTALPGADLIALSLSDPAVLAALGVPSNH